MCCVEGVHVDIGRDMMGIDEITSLAVQLVEVSHNGGEAVDMSEA